MWSIREILESRSVGVIGASRDPGKSGSQVLRALQEASFQGKFAGVNPHGGEVFHTPLYRTLDDIPFPVDLAVLHIPPEAIPSALNQCARKGVKGVVITSEGFAEAGAQGAQIQEEVRRILRSTGMRGFGPNTLGLVNTATGLTTSYFASRRTMRPGSIGIVAQSGTFLGALLMYLGSFESFRLSKGIGLGNKVDVDECEVLSYLAEDEQTRVIGMYLEGLRDGRRFLEVARKVTAKKPVVLLKGGRTKEGARAAASHTASMAMEDSLVDAALRQARVLRMAGIDDFIQTLKGFVTMPLPRGRRVAIVTYSGAQGILSADAVVQAGLELARFQTSTLDKLSRVIATPPKRENPVDLFPDMLAHGFEKTTIEILKSLLEDEGVDGIIFISFAIFGPESLRPLAEIIRGSCRKPVFFSFLGAKEIMEGSQQFLEAERIPCFDFPEMAVRVFANMWKFASEKSEDS